MSDHIPDLTKMIGETACNATPREELRHQIMSSIIPKNEREWWANRTIKQLELELAEANKTNRLQYELITTAEKRGVDKSKEELNAANERIKRLESVENSHAAVLNAIDNWIQQYKAKEDKS